MNNQYLFLDECVEKFGVSSAVEVLRFALKTGVEVKAFISVEAEAVGHGEALDGSVLEVGLGKIKLEGEYSLPDGLLGALVYGGKEKVQLTELFFDGLSATDVVEYGESFERIGVVLDSPEDISLGRLLIHEGCRLEGEESHSQPITMPIDKPNYSPVEKRAYSTAEAALYIGRSESYLRQVRMADSHENLTLGPEYRKQGRRVHYLKEDLDRWLEKAN